MTSDEILVDRMRRILSRRDGCSERRMFDTVCFMMHGNMRAGTWKGFLIVRFDKKDHDAMLAEPYTGPADMNGRAMKGWALVEPVGIASDDQLAVWLDRAARFAGSLPAKERAPKARPDGM